MNLKDIKRGAVLLHDCDREDCKLNGKFVRVLGIKRNGGIMIVPVQASTKDVIFRRVPGAVCSADTLTTAGAHAQK